jgi:hypothetical protein
MNDTTFDIEKITLLNIAVVSATLENNNAYSASDLADLKLAFQYQLDPGINLSTRRAQILADFDIRAFRNLEEPSVIQSQYKISFVFHVDNLPELVTIEENILKYLNEELLASLLNIAYSTSRGILYTRFLGTVLDGIILPVISTADLSKQSNIKPILTKR